MSGHSIHLTFNLAILAFSIAMIAITIPNVYYFQDLQKNGGTPHIGKTSSGVMMALNIVALVAEFMVMVWAIFRVYSHHATVGAMESAGMSTKGALSLDLI